MGKPDRARKRAARPNILPEWKVFLLLLVAGFFIYNVIPCGASLAVDTPAVPSAPSSRGTEETASKYFTDLPLITHTGKSARFFTDMLKDKIVLISGFYINCTTICPRQNMILSRLQKLIGEHLGRDVFMVSITVDPERDTLEKVKEYADVWDARPGWDFLTGKPENVNWINYRLGQYYEDPEMHRGAYLLGNLKTGLWFKSPPQSQVEDLYRRIQKLLEDTGEDKE